MGEKKTDNAKALGAVYTVSVPEGTITNPKRVGRGPGSRTGCTAGVGTKGQKARAGHKIRPGFEGGQMPLYRRLPRRGFSNYPFKQKPVVISLSVLEAKYDNGEVVSIETLVAKNVIKNDQGFVKILGTGELRKKLTIHESVFTALSVREKITALGGTVQLNEAEKALETAKSQAQNQSASAKKSAAPIKDAVKNAEEAPENAGETAE